MSSGMLADTFFYNARTQFNDGFYFEAQGGFARLAAQAEGLDRWLLEGLAALAAAFELYRRRRMPLAAVAQLDAALTLFGRIPLAAHSGFDLRQLRQLVAAWRDHWDAGDGRRGPAPEPIILP